MIVLVHDDEEYKIIKRGRDEYVRILEKSKISEDRVTCVKYDSSCIEIHYRAK